MALKIIIVQIFPNAGVTGIIFSAHKVILRLSNAVYQKCTETHFISMARSLPQQILQIPLASSQNSAAV